MKRRGRDCRGKGGAFAWRAAALIAVLSSGAWAQSVPEAPAVSPAVNVPWAEGHRWTRAGLDEDVAGLTVTPSGAVLALTEQGAVWRWGGESSWRMVLGPPGARLDDDDAIDEEELLLDAETLMGDQADFGRRGRSEEGDDEDADGDAEEADAGAAPEPGLAETEASDLLLDDRAPRRGALEADGALWAAQATAGLVLCSRSDGTWRSDDHGLTWESVPSLPPTYAFTDLMGTPGGILAGTVDGLRTSLDQGRSWVEVDDALSGVPIYSFVDDTERQWAGTAEGLFVSTPVMGWAKLLPRRDSDMPVWSMANDPYWRGGLWLSGPVGILRTDDGGQNMRPAGRNPLMGTQAILPMDSAGHVLAAGVDGVWESLDGGIMWRPLARGLPHPRVRSLARANQGVLCGGPEGVFILKRAEPTAAADLAIASETHKAEPPMGELVEVALRRPGLAIDSVLAHQNRAVGMLMPKLQITGRWDRYRYITAEHEAQNNNGGLHHGWFVGTTACFGNCSSSVSFSDVDVVALAEDYGVDVQSLPELAVVGDEVYVADSAGALAPVAANVAERMTQYRSEVANRVSELSISRRRLLEARADVRALSLKDQATHELRIQESAARIDVYTNGYFTRVLEGL